MPRWFKVTLGAVSVGLVAGAVLITYILHDLRTMEWDFSSADTAHYEASNEFYAALGTPECLTQNAVVQEAEKRGWEWRIEPEFQWETCPAAESPWLRVMIEPSLFMSTENENSAFFVFDDNGCSIDWRDAQACGD